MEAQNGGGRERASGEEVIQRRMLQRGRQGEGSSVHGLHRPVLTGDSSRAVRRAEGKPDKGKEMGDVETLMRRNYSSKKLDSNGVLRKNGTGLELYELMRINLENIMLSEKQAAEHGKYDIILCDIYKHEKRGYLFTDKLAVQAY